SIRLPAHVASWAAEMTIELRAERLVDRRRAENTPHRAGVDESRGRRAPHMRRCVADRARELPGGCARHQRVDHFPRNASPTREDRMPKAAQLRFMPLAHDGALAKQDVQSVERI